MYQKNVRNKIKCVLKGLQLVRQYVKIVSGRKKNNNAERHSCTGISGEHFNIKVQPNTDIKHDLVWMGGGRHSALAVF